MAARDLVADPALIEAFLDALQEQNDAAEFERLMLGDDTPRAPGLSVAFHDGLDALTLLAHGLYQELSALDALRGQQALERLQGRHPELWEQIALTQGGE